MPTITTAEELLSLREPSCRHELVRGELRRSPFRRATVFRRSADVRVLGPDGELTGDDVLPGFTLPLRDLFPSSR